jgi:hypothetical protein
VRLATFGVRDRVEASDFIHDRPERIALPPEDKFCRGRVDGQRICYSTLDGTIVTVIVAKLLSGH